MDISFILINQGCYISESDMLTLGDPESVQQE